MLFNDIIAIILASGKGERFGKPKAEAIIGGISFIEKIANTLREAGIEQIHIARDLDTPDMLSTLRLAVQELRSKKAKAYLVFPVDHPCVQSTTIDRICKMFLLMPFAIVSPSYKGKYGHPVLIPAGLDLNRNDHHAGLAGIIHSGDYTVVELPMDDPGILKNINRPEDLEQ